MTAARAGSSAAESEMVRRYRPALTSYCTRIVGPDLAEDVVNQALMQALVALRRDDRPAALRPWLFQIARNCAIDVARDKRVHSEISDHACGNAGPLARVEQRETMRSIVGELGRLSPNERRALVAREFEGSSYADIADELGHSVGAVRQMIFRARRRVREGALAIVPLLRLPRPGGADVLGAIGTCATTAVLATAGATAPHRHEPTAQPAAPATARVVAWVAPREERTHDDARPSRAASDSPDRPTAAVAPVADPPAPTRPSSAASKRPAAAPTDAVAAATPSPDVPAAAVTDDDTAAASNDAAAHSRPADPAPTADTTIKAKASRDDDDDQGNGNGNAYGRPKTKGETKGNGNGNAYGRARPDDAASGLAAAPTPVPANPAASTGPVTAPVTTPAERAPPGRARRGNGPR